ncbi:MAG: hypothetical protein CL666_14580 [Balneola sp.]|nr:hypothetical protein [Balneola sp.]|tara:strand:+ start:56823 stop:57155 length:333 start_codon:yes stop_codon:yes gene_type:complete
MKGEVIRIGAFECMGEKVTGALIEADKNQIDGSVLYENVDVIKAKKTATNDELEFISRIKADGSGTEPIDELFDPTWGGPYHLTRLSLSEDTYIASGFNSYVVKLKTEQA